MNAPFDGLPTQLARRAFLRRAGIGLGAMALSALDGARAQDPARGRALPDFAPRAKRVVWLYMAGGMTHLDTFDHKPELARRDGEPMPESLTKGQQIAQLQGQALRVLGPQHAFARYGSSGQSMATIWPHLGQCADDLCIVRSLHTDAINHDPAHTFMNTGTMNQGRPAMGSWLSYGLGAEARDLPAFVVMVSTGGYGQKQPIAARQWHSGFLPGQHQGVLFRGAGEPVMYAQSPPGVDAARQRDVVDAVRRIDAAAGERLRDPEIAARLRQYELAFRMQASVPELTDLRGEPQRVLDLYGATPGDGSFGSNCLLARRLLERGVRFVQLYHRDWDHHGAVKEHSAGTAREVDRGAAALLLDLKQRGMLDDTIVVFGSEFGRTPMAQGDGRDHHMQAFTMWFAGGGFRAGHAHGATDDFGYRAVQDRVSVHDVHATLLHLLGIDHERFTFRHQGLDDRLTGVEPAKVVRALLA